MVDPQLLRSLKDENISLKHENEDLKDQNSRLWKVIQSLNELQSNPQAITSPSDLLEMVMNILTIALDAAESEDGSILLLDEENDELVFVAVVGDRSEELTDYRIPADQVWRVGLTCIKKLLWLRMCGKMTAGSPQSINPLDFTPKA